MLTAEELANLSPYLSVVPGRFPDKKIHHSLSHARAAISNACYHSLHQDCQIYEYTASGWQLLENVPKGTHKDHLPWKKAKNV